MPGKLQVIVGGQFGSEGKGAITAHLARTEKRELTAVRVAGPNAGHTAYDDEGVKYALRALPVASIARPDSKLVIAAGSEIDFNVLDDEIMETAHYHSAARLIVDGEATIIEPKHAHSESSITTGTTGKGIGGARAARLMREASLAYDGAADRGYATSSTPNILMNDLEYDACVQIEGTQGYGLGLHAGYYPHSTSSNCRAIDFMAMAGLSPWSVDVKDLEIWIVFRTYPIRIAGNSGPMYMETSWEELSASTEGHIQPEYTTVTQKRRRVGEWDQELANEAMAANGFPSDNLHVALTFLDYVAPSCANKTELNTYGRDVLRHFEVLLGKRVELVGTGPNTVVDLR